MKEKRFSLPEQRNFEYAHTQAYTLAAKELGEIQDIARMCEKSGARYQKSGTRHIITLKHLNRRYQITLPEIDITLTDSPEEAVPLKSRVLILHYLIHAQGTPLHNKLITFKELPEGILYLPTFAKRTTAPLIKYFGDTPHQLVPAAGLGGRKVDFGDVAVTISAFPRMPVSLVLWRGDSEFPPEAGILFDASITDYLPTEDIIITCESIIWTLVKSLKQS